MVKTAREIESEPHRTFEPETGHAHVTSVKLLLTVFAILVVLTILTVGITWFDFGYTMNLVVALVIAVVKAVFVLLYFMHLRWDHPFNALIFVAALVFLALFIGGTLLDSTEYQDRFTPPNIPQLRE